MIDRPLLFSGLFSLGLHGVLASFLCPILLKTPSEHICTLSVVWEKSSSLQDHPASQKRKPLLTQPKKVEISPSFQHAETYALASSKTPAKNKAPFTHQTAHPQKSYTPLPSYPWICRKRHQEGIVTVQVILSSKGRVIKALLHKSSGYERLDQVALQAVKSWILAEGPSQKILSIAFRLKG
jgi:TonB family protein